MGNAIHVVGDSHIQTMFLRPGGFEEWPFITHYLPDRTAFMLSDHGDQVEKALHNLEKNDILFLFGEIDCRARIFRRCKENCTTIKVVVDDVVNRYTNYIKLLSQVYRKLSIMTVVPTGDEENIYFLPHYPDKEIRKLITLTFNECLHYYCSVYNISLIDTYFLLVDGVGERKQDFIKDDCHLNYKAGQLIWETFFKNRQTYE